jgi:hypothetical protein
MRDRIDEAMTMNDERLRTLIEAYGAWPDRWPEAERNAALAALANLPEADEALREAQALDALLDTWRLAPVPDDLAGRIAARAVAQRGPNARRPADRRPVLGLRGRPVAWMSSAGLAAACAAGVLVGVQLGDLGAARAGDAEAAGNLLDGGATAFGAPADLEKSG